MRIAFDATAILGPMSKNRGIGNYSLGQFSAMLQKDKENDYFFFNLFEEEYSLKEHVAESVSLTEVKMYSGQDHFLLRDPYKNTIKKIIRKFLTENKIDLFYITSPFDNLNVHYESEWFEGVKTVALVYDIIPYIFKERYLADQNAYNWYMGCIDFIREMDQIQVISQSVKDDLVQYLQFSPDNIDVIWGGVDPGYQIIDIAENERQALYQKFHIRDRFIMCTGGDDERKNIAGLIEAYSRLSMPLREQYQLVIVCKLSEAAVNRYTQLATDLGCKDRVIFTNFVSNEELLYFYNLASLMAFPSKYEGFGLPVVEAWACGTPVLTSNNSSLVQIAGDGAVLVNPFDVEDIAKGLEYALSECDLQELLKKGQGQLKNFQWERVAENSIVSINLLKNKKTDVANANEKRKRIAFFTPLPPLQSGISDYSVDIIGDLAKYYDIDIYIDSNYEPTIIIPDGVRICNHKSFPRHYREYFEILYQVGNSAFHSYMFRYIQKYKGIVVLHDYNMHGVTIHRCFTTERKKNYSLFKKMLKEDYCVQQVEEYVENLKSGKTGYHIYDMPVNGFIVNYAKKIIVHSYESKAKLLSKNIGRNVSQIWHYANVGEYSGDNRAAKQLMGYQPEDIVIAAFGHIHATKRIIPIIKAYKQLRDENSNVKLLLVGKLDKELQQEFYQLVNNFGIAKDVTVTGYTELENFVKYIDVTDICLNLRYPYNGETSGSLMRIFAKGKCVVVNDIGSFGEFPDEICIKLPSAEVMSAEEEVMHIYAALQELITKPDAARRLGKAAYQFAQENLALDKVGAAYVKCIESPIRPHLEENDIINIADYLFNYETEDEEIAKVVNTLCYLM